LIKDQQEHLDFKMKDKDEDEIIELELSEDVYSLSFLQFIKKQLSP
jgi:hypothetical protein